MNKEKILSNDTIQKLRNLLGSVNGIKGNLDLYSICINQSLHGKIKG